MSDLHRDRAFDDLCPACASRDIEADPPEVMGLGTILLPCDCLACGATWTEIYGLTAVGDLKTRDQPVLYGLT